MAIRVDINKITLNQLIENGIQSLKRANAKEFNPAMRDLREKDIAALQTAANTMTEIK